jgi:hypothetical protein
MEPTAACALMPISLLLPAPQQQFTLPVLPRRSLIQEFAQTAVQLTPTGLHARVQLKQLLVQLVHI